MDLVDTAFKAAKERLLTMVNKLQAPSSQWLDSVEAEIGTETREINYDLLQGHVNCKGVGDIGLTLFSADGNALTHRRVLEIVLQTKYGKIKIRRMGYSLPGHEMIFPLDAVLNLPASSFSFELQRFIVRLLATTSFEEALELTQKATGVTVGKRQAQEIVNHCSTDFEAFYDVQKKESVKAPILVLTTDGKGIVMRPESLREETRNRAEKSTRKMRTRLARGEKANRKRMAQVASIYAIERFKRTPEEVINELARRNASQRRPRPTQKRVWASVEKNAKVVIQSMFEEAKKRDPRHKKEWVILVDGHKQQLHLVKLFARKFGGSPTIILDIIHAIEYLWIAARLFHKETSAECERWVEDKLCVVLNGKAGRVAGSIRMLAAKTKLTEGQKKIAEDCALYLTRKKKIMDYARYLERGYPIATGVIEGACRHLIKDRMDITGARWSLSGAEAILKLRSLVKSGDFDSYWSFHVKQEHERNHVSKLANLEQLKPLLPMKKAS